MITGVATEKETYICQSCGFSLDASSKREAQETHDTNRNCEVQVVLKSSKSDELLNPSDKINKSKESKKEVDNEICEFTCPGCHAVFYETEKKAYEQHRKLSCSSKVLKRNKFN